MTRSIPRQTIWGLGLLLCAAHAGCGAGRADFAPGPTECGGDGACPSALDPDAGPDAGFTAGPPPDAAIRGLESDEACFDGQDNDANGPLDCDEPACQGAFRSCCVGRSTAACCSAPSEIAALSFDDCTGALGSECSTLGVTPFGSPLPKLVAGVLYPNGDLSYDSGVVVDAPIAPGRAITVHATLAIPAAPCADGCVEAVGVGLTAEAGYGNESTVRPLAGLVVSVSRRSVDLVLEGEVAGRVSLASGQTSIDVVLVLAPDGSVSTEGLPGGTLRGRVQRRGALRLVAWGRNMNRADADGARIVALSASASTCDAPSTWTERTALALGDGAMIVPAMVAAPSVADSPTESRLLFEAGGRIVLARRATASATYALVGGYENAALVDPDGGALRDPELVALSDGSWRAYVATDTGAIAYAEGLAGGDVFALRTVVVAPAALGVRIARLDGPSVLAPSGADAWWHLVVRAVDVDGNSALVHLVSTDGLGFALAPGATLESATLRTPQGTFSAFDRDEVAAPDVFRHAGSIGIAYAGRSGARWSIGLLASDDFVHVRAVSGDVALAGSAVLSGTGTSADVDALSATDPDVVVRAGQVELFYAGSDGSRTRLAHVARPSIEGT